MLKVEKNSGIKETNTLVVEISYRNRNLKNQSEFIYVTTTSMDSLMQIPDPNRRAAVCLKQGF